MAATEPPELSHDELRVQARMCLQFTARPADADEADVEALTEFLVTIRDAAVAMERARCVRLARARFREDSGWNAHYQNAAVMIAIALDEDDDGRD